MKKILGLDLGTNSIGWALVNEATKENEESSIIKLGVRVNPLTVDEKKDFENGNPLSTNAARTLKRGARRNLQRYKLRRKQLIKILISNAFIKQDTPLTEIGKNTTHQTIALRAKASREKIELEDLAKVLLLLNKKRGYKSSRKTKSEEDGVAIDGMEVAKLLYDQQLTPGQFALQLLKEGKKYIPDFYRSDLKEEFKRIWDYQKTFYPEILTDRLFENLQDKNKAATWAICKEPFNIEGIKLEGKAQEQKIKKLEFRVKGLSEKMDLEHLAIALQEINNSINKSSGYLGKISDRSKKLYLNKKTVGQFLYEQIKENPHTSLKNQVFYRQDYLDEFEQIWETQTKFYSNILTPKLKEQIRDVVIFYQRKLKSQKGLLSFCQFESKEIPRKDKEGNIILNKSTGNPKTQTIGQRVIPKSSPLFQEFKIWQNINNIEFKNVITDEKLIIKEIEDEIRQELFEELNLRGDLKSSNLLKILANYIKIGKISDWKCNFEKIEGNRTNQVLFNVYQTIAEREGYGFDWSKKSASQIREELKTIFPEIGINPSVLDFDSCLDGKEFEQQDSYQLWHLLYSAEDDEKITEKDRLIYGNDSVNLKKNLYKKFGFKPEYAKLLANISLSDDHGSLSAKAIKKILPFLISGNIYPDACSFAGYNHSHSITKEENEARELVDKLDILPKNSLRNPVVEKILNQMINLVNQIIETYGKPDEVRIELARELKKSAKERKDATKGIAAATRVNDEIRKIIEKDFGFKPTRNDIIRYKLWQELEQNGHKTLFTNKYIPRENIFSKEIEIEHIIPKALLFDDSFSNKTLAYSSVNKQKDKRTAYDFISNDYANDLTTYEAIVKDLENKGAISKGKMKKLLMSAENLPSDFIERDLRNSQYIAKKAKEILFKAFKNVNTTTGKITDELRSDWDLVNVMKELNFPKYKTLGLTEVETRFDVGQEKIKMVEVIKDWTKRNDHRHHAMDALTVAFTSPSHIQYINNLSASEDTKSKLYGIKTKITKVINGKRRFIAPMPNFRTEAKKHIEDILISFKTKNKVVTKNINKTKKEKGYNIQSPQPLTPRGQLHKETVYGKSKKQMTKATKLSKKFTLKQAQLIVHKTQKKIVLNHLKEFDNNPNLAFDSKTLKKQPIIYNEKPLTEVLCFEEIFTIRKDISPDLKLDKIVDEGVKKAIEKHLEKFGNDKKKAFSNLEENPIWLNEEKGISIKRVTITGVNNAEPLHYKKDHLGKEILDKNGNPQPVDFVSFGNNHHVAIYKDANGKLQEKVVSFFEAVARVNQNLPVIDKIYKQDEGWEFLFTMKQNEMFVFPSENFNPKEIDLMDEKYAKEISKHLFRVQKLANKDYFFRHHLETNVENNKSLQDTAWKRIGLSGLEGIVKVRINHLGKIVQVGEY